MSKTSHSVNSTRTSHSDCCDVHCNSLWSIWYGLLSLSLEAYIVYVAISRFLIYVSLPWPDGEGQPYLELNLYVGLIGTGLVLIPFYFITFMFRIGNLSNDGSKLGVGPGEASCSIEPASLIPGRRDGSGFLGKIWHHGCPTAALLHLISAFCFVLPKIFIEAKLIEVGFFSRDNIWRTDLDWLVSRKNRLVILQFLTGNNASDSHTFNGSNLDDDNDELFITTSAAPSYLHPAAQIRDYLATIDNGSNWWPVSPEFVNYALALIVFAVRYPAVFWKTNKTFSFIFSLQLIANAFQNLMSLGGISIMYKVQLLGPQNVLHKYEPFLLNTPICILLYILSCLIVTVNSCVVYMYGFQKYSTFIEYQKEKHSIMLRSSRTSLWSYFSHCSAMCVLIALMVVNAPLLYDYTLIYKGSLDGSVITAVISTIIHLFFWIILWLCLTLKQNWNFKLRVTVGRMEVMNPRSVQLVNDIELNSKMTVNNTESEETSDSVPLLIISRGKAVIVKEAGPKRIIINTLMRVASDKEENNRKNGVVNESMQRVQKELMSKVSRDAHPSARSVTSSPRHTSVISPNSSPVHRTALAPLASPGQVILPDEDKGQHDNKQHEHGSDKIQTHCLLSNEIIIEEEVVENNDEKYTLLPRPPHLPPTSNVMMNHEVDQMRNGSPLAQMMFSPRSCLRTITPITPTLIHYDIQDVTTPKSNRSIDSGLPTDDVSTGGSSNSSPPDNLIPSLTAIDFSPPSTNSVSDVHTRCGEWKKMLLTTSNQSVNESDMEKTNSFVIQCHQKTSNHNTVSIEDEDPYGRCSNMHLTSFTETSTNISGVECGRGSSNRDPRIIKLTPSTGPPSSASASLSSTPRQESPTPLHQSKALIVPLHNTLPNSHGATNLMGNGTRIINHTLPARGITAPVQHSRGSNGSFPISSGRHFKPFDHRKMNPMEEIREHPYGTINKVAVSQQQSQMLSFNSDSRGTGTLNGSNIIIQKRMPSHLSHMPSELRHTNTANHRLMNVNGITTLSTQSPTNNDTEKKNFLVTPGLSNIQSSQ